MNPYRSQNISFQVTARREQLVYHLRDQIERLHSPWRACLWGWMDESHFELSLKHPLISGAVTPKLIGSFSPAGETVHVDVSISPVYHSLILGLVMIIVMLSLLMKDVLSGDFSNLPLYALFLIPPIAVYLVDRYMVDKSKRLFCVLLDEYS